MVVCMAARMSHSQSRNGPQARMVVEFLAELPKLTVESCLALHRLCSVLLHSKIVSASYVRSRENRAF